MPLPTSKQELADWILRRLGAPVINVEIADIQLEDCIDEAVQFYQEYHYDGVERTYRTIKIDSSLLSGNNRSHQNANAPMYDPTNGKYRVGDRVMTYATDQSPDAIWVKYDSEERIVKSFFFEDSEGVWFAFDSDLVGLESVIQADSDHRYVNYDSDLHNAYLYTVLDDSDFLVLKASPTYDSDSIFVDSDSGKVVYDSDAHVVYQYDLDSEDAEGGWVDSDTNKVVYDSDKHSSFVYALDSEGVWFDSDGEYVVYDSDRYTVVTYVSDSEGVWYDSEGEYVLFDSDRYGSTIFEEKDISLYNIADSDTNIFYVKDENDGNYYPISDYYDNILEFPQSQQTVEGKYRVDSDTHMNINGIAYSINRNITNFTIKGVGEDSYDSDGYGNLLINTILNGIRLNVQTGLGASIITTTILDSDLVSSDRTPILPNTVYYEGNMVTFNAVYSRKFRRTVPVYTKGWISRTNRLTQVKTKPAGRYSRSTTRLQRYKRQFTRPVLYTRSLELLGRRYNRLDSEIDREVLSFSQMYRKEDIVLNEPTTDLDYSQSGHVGIPLPENIIGVNKIFRIDNFSGMGMWNYEYQYFLNNFDYFFGNSGGGSMPMTNYYTTKMNMDFIDHIMNVQPAIRFNKHRNRVYIDSSWSRLNNSSTSGDYYLMMECYEVNDPEVFNNVYKDSWLKRYCVSLSKMQWGSNLKKYQNTELPGGIVLSGQELYDEGKEEAEKLEEELRNTMLEMDFLVG